jgi:hypothetical protein
VIKAEFRWAYLRALVSTFHILDWSVIDWLRMRLGVLEGHSYHITSLIGPVHVTYVSVIIRDYFKSLDNIFSVINIDVNGVFRLCSIRGSQMTYKCRLGFGKNRKAEHFLLPMNVR